MKLTNKSVLIFGLLSINAFANEYIPPIENITVYKTDSPTLSIQNLSKDSVEIDIYGEYFNLTPSSGIKFECLGYENLELQIKNNIHDYFEVPCKSRVLITEQFTNES